MRGLGAGSKVWAEVDGANVPLTLAEEIASGREGTAYRIVETPGGERLVVKIVVPSHRKAAQEVTSALMRMDPSEWFDRASGCPRLSLPVAAAYLSQPVTAADAVCDGYFMPDLLTATRVPTRSAFEFPQRRRLELIGWHTLVGAALSLSSTIDRLHSHDMFVGDLALENTFIDCCSGAITVIDVDSFSAVASAGSRLPPRHFRMENTPPEILRDLTLLDKRSVEADRFALAIAIGGLLLEGFHPFGGTPRYVEAVDEEEQDEAVNIRHGYSWITHPNELTTPQHQPQPAILPPPLLNLFWEAFVLGHTDPSMRPSAASWCEALRAELLALMQCSTNPRHLFARHLSNCPWCEWTVRFGRDPYPPSALWDRQDCVSLVVQVGEQTEPVSAYRAPSRDQASDDSLPQHLHGCPDAIIELLNAVVRSHGITRTNELARIQVLEVILAGLEKNLSIVPRDGIALSEVGAWVAAMERGRQREPKLERFFAVNLKSKDLEVRDHTLLRRRPPISGCSASVQAILDDFAMSRGIPTNLSIGRGEMMTRLADAFAREPDALPEDGIDLREIGAWIAAVSRWDVTEIRIRLIEAIVPRLVDSPLCLEKNRLSRC